VQAQQPGWGDYDGVFRSNNQQVIVGDTDRVGSFDVGSSIVCKVWINRIYLNNAPLAEGKLDWRVSPQGFGGGDIYWVPKKVETTIDTAKIDVSGESIAGNCGGFVGTAHVIAKATSRNDSLLLLRPRSWTIDLYPDSIIGEWVGYTEPYFSNKTDSSVTLKNWTLEIPTSNEKVSITILDDSVKVDSIFSLAHSGKHKLLYRLHTPKGPITEPIQYDAKINVLVSSSGRDSIFSQLVTLRLNPTSWKQYSIAIPSGLKLTSPPYINTDSIITIKLDPRTRGFQIMPVAYPFSMRVDSSMRSQFLLKIRISALSKSGGRYYEELKLYLDIPDFNGEIRKDSLVIPLVLESSPENDLPEWQNANLSSSKIRELVLSKNDILYANLDSSIVYSLDGGEKWYPISQSDSMKHITVDEDYNLFGIAPSKRVIKTNVVKQSIWKLLKNGLCLHYDDIGGHFCGTGDVIALSSVTGKTLLAIATYDYYNNYHREDQHLSGVFRSSDKGNNWESLATSIIGTQVFLDSNQDALVINKGAITKLGTGPIFTIPDSITTIAVAPNGAYFVGTHTRGIYRSDDQGKHWTKTSLVLQDVRSIACMRNGTIYIAAYDCGVFKSSNQGQTWEGVNGGLQDKKIT